ncbi:hypothetical protein SEA_BAXTERFOX_41 [Gordonia phage BaxterFox]|uniref:Uncharacterized protein n=1 Tax=Gordonia phage BaxterFox TaxID=1821549 RepID=A0A142KCL8_9CAUD|nr:hypothetical protein SEA_BAXTERFOX_41 [Gordonia phage BaxterFox]AMS03851.1 hypothetical protein SEA_BAXTERFOX_41 [Gordonia phage BaxterFox]
MALRLARGGTRRHLVPELSVELATESLGCSPAPLLEEERDFRVRAGVANPSYPVHIDRPVSVA